MEHLDTFLALYPPFDALGAAELRALASTAREHSYAAGEAILVEDGLPGTGASFGREEITSYDEAFRLELPVPERS